VSLSWLATSALYATNGPPQRIPFRFSTRDSGHTISASAVPWQQADYSLDLPHGRVRYVQDPIQESYSPHVRLAENERDGLASCPTAINCQLSLLCYERARELECDILVGLQMLLVEPNAKKNSSETLFVAYTVLTVLMDAYESYAISFQVWVSCTIGSRDPSR
jgi:hypothetical protein